MREQIRDKARLEHILEAIDFAIEFTHLEKHILILNGKR
jgi:hypothetical protein